jgi:hypothetical protein
MIEERGMRFDRVAERVGISKDRLSHILAYRRPAPPWLYERAAVVLNCTPAELRPADPAPVEAAA